MEVIGEEVVTMGGGGTAVEIAVESHKYATF
jgi:hypothetical protein